jgi:methylenetetrahydrofolate--tRNA-(uracil-5-)-methyltransferase
VNFGLFPPLASVPTRSPEGERLRGTAKTLAKKHAMSDRALADLATWAAGEPARFPADLEPSTA